jgi:hypothetical protein
LTSCSSGGQSWPGAFSRPTPRCPSL